MNNTKTDGIVALAICSALTDFLILSNKQIIFPRDRICNLLISFIIALLGSFCCVKINFEKNIVKIISIALIVIRAMYLMVAFAAYICIFHGLNRLEIFVFTIIIFAVIFEMEDNNICRINIFFVLTNIVFASTIILLCAGKINVANIYANELNVNFSIGKLFIYFDILTVLILLKDDKRKLQITNKFVVITTIVFIFLTVVQGMSVKGNLMYILSPLQTLSQIFSTSNIRRYDYIFTAFFLINYFGAVILYSRALKLLLRRSLYNV